MNAGCVNRSTSKNRVGSKTKPDISFLYSAGYMLRINSRITGIILYPVRKLIYNNVSIFTSGKKILSGISPQTKDRKAVIKQRVLNSSAVLFFVCRRKTNK
jgi:hypothetical protein